MTQHIVYLYNDHEHNMTIYFIKVENLCPSQKLGNSLKNNQSDTNTNSCLRRETPFFNKGATLTRHNLTLAQQLNTMYSLR